MSNITYVSDFKTNPAEEKAVINDKELDKAFDNYQLASKNLREKLSLMPEYQEMIKTRDIYNNKKQIRDPYRIQVEKLSFKEQQEEIAKALKDIALDNIDMCLTYSGNEDDYMKFVNRIHGLKDEWKAFRRVNVNNYNYYLAKAKFMLNNYSYDYSRLFVEEYKFYIYLMRTKNLDSYKFTNNRSSKIEKEIEEQIIQQNKEIKQNISDSLQQRINEEIHNLSTLNRKRQKIKKEAEEKISIYNKKLFNDLPQDEFEFRLNSVRILANAGSIPELAEYAPIINYVYFCDLPITEAGKMMYDASEILHEMASENYKLNKDNTNNKVCGDESTQNNQKQIEEKFSEKELYDNVNNYFESNDHRGSVNNEIRKLEKALANYLIESEKNFITGKEYFSKYAKIDNQLDEQEKMIELGRLVNENKELKSTLITLSSKPPKVKRK